MKFNQFTLVFLHKPMAVYASIFSQKKNIHAYKAINFEMMQCYYAKQTLPKGQLYIHM